MSDVWIVEQLHLACDEVVQGGRVQVIRDDKTRSWMSGPSLLSMLALSDAAAGTAGGSAGGGSRSVINHSVVALLTDIADTSRRQLLDLGVSDHGGDVRLNVRAATAATIVTADDDEMTMWLYVLRRWRVAGRAALQLDNTRRQWLRGIACPNCSAVTTTHREAGSANLIHSSALNVQWVAPVAGLEHDDEAWVWDSIQCRHCAMRWVRGVTVNDLLRDLRAQGQIGRAS